MFSNKKTFDSILEGKISVIQYKNGYRFGFDAVFLAAFVNGFLEKKKKKTISIADVGSGVGTISLIIALKNPLSNILAFENNDEYLKIAEENIKNNNFNSKIKTKKIDILSLENKLMSNFDLVVTNPPFNKHQKNESKNKLKEDAKRICDFSKWIENCVKLLKSKGVIFLIIPTDILHITLSELIKKTGSFKIFPCWPNHSKKSKRMIVFAQKGGASPTELMPGIVLYNSEGKMTQKAETLSKEGIFKFL